MNANTRLRLWKEARALLPMWAAVAVWIAAPFLLPVNDPLPYAFSGFLFGCAVLGPVCVGHEFTHRTMGALLAQPVPRRQLWREKHAVCGAAFALLTILLLLLAWSDLRQSGFGNGFWSEARLYVERGTGTLADGLSRYIEVFRRTGEGWILFALTSLGQSLGFLKADPSVYRDLQWTPEVIWVVASFFGPPLLGFCTGPALTLVTRNALGGAAATFIYPFFLLIAGLLIVASMGDLSARVEEQFLLSYVLLVGGIYSGGMFLYGCRRFQCLEDANLLAQELAPPRQLSALFSCLTRHTAPGRHGPTANLLRKELRLQQPAFLVAVFLVALWLTFIVVWKVHPPVGAEMLIVPSILLALGSPVTVGIVSTAEERNLGVHEWHLTLPVSARRQWWVKVIVALGVNALLGLLLPGLLAHASSWLANNPQLVADIPGRNVSPLIIANLVIICAGLYASSTSANPIRALIGTIVLFVCGGLTLSLGNSAAGWFADAIDHAPAPLRDGWWPAPEFLHEIHVMIINWLLLGALLSPVAMALMNFRRALDSLRRPMLQMGVLLVIIGMMMSYTSAWGILATNYERAYYDYDYGLRWENTVNSERQLNKRLIQQQIRDQTKPVNP